MDNNRHMTHNQHEGHFFSFKIFLIVALNTGFVNEKDRFPQFLRHRIIPSFHRKLRLR